MAGWQRPNSSPGVARPSPGEHHAQEILKIGLSAEVQDDCIKNLTGRSTRPIGGVPYSQGLAADPRAWLTETKANPALERGQYEKQMDRHWSCRCVRFACRHRNCGHHL